jgi:alkanesulfonate monooxygenase SsuD/methylene tetrahydromethanopterin reductase-like flavin-dependent oxidoreductase (luciferase family)
VPVAGPAAGGRRPVPQTDGEFGVDSGAARTNRPAIAVSGTPGQIVTALQQVIDETGARRLLVETFSRDEARLSARAVIPVAQGAQLDSCLTRCPGRRVYSVDNL